MHKPNYKSCGYVTPYLHDVMDDLPKYEFQGTSVPKLSDHEFKFVVIEAEGYVRPEEFKNVIEREHALAVWLRVESAAEKGVDTNGILAFYVCPFDSDSDNTQNIRPLYVSISREQQVEPPRLRPPLFTPDTASQRNDGPVRN